MNELSTAITTLSSIHNYPEHNFIHSFTETHKKTVNFNRIVRFPSATGMEIIPSTDARTPVNPLVYGFAWKLPFIHLLWECKTYQRLASRRCVVLNFRRACAVSNLQKMIQIEVFRVIFGYWVRERVIFHIEIGNFPTHFNDFQLYIEISFDFLTLTIPRYKSHRCIVHVYLLIVRIVLLSNAFILSPHRYLCAVIWPKSTIFRNNRRLGIFALSLTRIMISLVLVLGNVNCHFQCLASYNG